MSGKKEKKPAEKTEAERKAEEETEKTLLAIQDEVLKKKEKP